MKRHYKIVAWSLIPLLFVGILGVGLFSQRAPLARADGGQSTPCDAANNTQGNPASVGAFPALGNQVWQCPVNPVFANDATDCLHQRKQPTTASASIRCFPFNNSKNVNIVCQTQGDLVGNSNVWDEIATVDLKGNPTYAYVSDYFMDTAGKGFSTDTFANTNTNGIKNCAGLNLPPVP